MTLPECKDLCGEEPHDEGFCPIEFYVPFDLSKGFNGQFGFVSGAVWADDSSSKLEFLDLSRIEEGVFKREARFGYIELPEELSLSDAVNFDWYDLPDDLLVRINQQRKYNLLDGTEAE